MPQDEGHLSKFVEEQGTVVLEWPVNSPSESHQKCTYKGYVKKKLKPEDTTKVKNLERVINNIWVQKLDANYFKDVSAFMPKHL